MPKPSAARQASTACATSVPHAIPRSRDSSAVSAVVAERRERGRVALAELRRSRRETVRRAPYTRQQRPPPGATLREERGALRSRRRSGRRSACSGARSRCRHRRSPCGRSPRARWLDEFGVFVAMSVSTKIWFQSSTWFGCSADVCEAFALALTLAAGLPSAIVATVAARIAIPVAARPSLRWRFIARSLLFAEVTAGSLASGRPFRKLEIPTVCEECCYCSCPSRCASSVRERMPSLRYARVNAPSTVCSVTKSAAATSRFVRPSATSAAIRCSASVSSSRDGRAAADPRQLGSGLVGPERRADPLEARERVLERPRARPRAASPAAASGRASRRWPGRTRASKSSIRPHERAGDGDAAPRGRTARRPRALRLHSGWPAPSCRHATPGRSAARARSPHPGHSCAFRAREPVLEKSHGRARARPTRRAGTRGRPLLRRARVPAAASAPMQMPPPSARGGYLARRGNAEARSSPAPCSGARHPRHGTQPRRPAPRACRPLWCSSVIDTRPARSEVDLRLEGRVALDLRERLATRLGLRREQVAGRRRSVDRRQTRQAVRSARRAPRRHGRHRAPRHPGGRGARAEARRGRLGSGAPRLV